MLERPEISDEMITRYLEGEYGVEAAGIIFLSLGADVNAAAYRVDTAQDRSYFLKLRRGTYDTTPVALTKFLSDEGVRQVIGPLVTRKGRLWSVLDEYRAVLYPFIEGRNGYDAVLTEKQWFELGSALRRIHAIRLPWWLARPIPVEDFGSEHRDTVRGFLSRVESHHFDDPVASKVAAFLRDHE